MIIKLLKRMDWLKIMIFLMIILGLLSLSRIIYIGIKGAKEGDFDLIRRNLKDYERIDHFRAELKEIMK